MQNNVDKLHNCWVVKAIAWPSIKKIGTKKHLPILQLVKRVMHIPYAILIYTKQLIYLALNRIFKNINEERYETEFL